MKDESAKKHRRWMRRAVVLPVAGVLLLGGVAAAAWLLEANGTGTTTIQTGTSSLGTPAIVAVSAVDTTALVPGGSERITWSANYPGGPAQQVDAVVTSVTGTSDNTNCSASNFTVTQGAVGASASNGVGISFPYDWSSGTLSSSGGDGGSTPIVTMNADAPAGCQNVSIDVAVVIS